MRAATLIHTRAQCLSSHSWVRPTKCPWPNAGVLLVNRLRSCPNISPACASWVFSIAALSRSWQPPADSERFQADRKDTFLWPFFLTPSFVFVGCWLSPHFSIHRWFSVGLILKKPAQQYNQRCSNVSSRLAERLTHSVWIFRAICFAWLLVQSWRCISYPSRGAPVVSVLDPPEWGCAGDL